MEEASRETASGHGREGVWAGYACWTAPPHQTQQKRERSSRCSRFHTTPESSSRSSTATACRRSEGGARPRGAEPPMLMASPPPPRPRLRSRLESRRAIAACLDEERLHEVSVHEEVDALGRHVLPVRGHCRPEQQQQHGTPVPTHRPGGVRNSSGRRYTVRLLRGGGSADSSSCSSHASRRRQARCAGAKARTPTVRYCGGRRAATSPMACRRVLSSCGCCLATPSAFCADAGEQQKG